jgi:serine/threonine-protein kinase RCK2
MESLKNFLSKGHVGKRSFAPSLYGSVRRRTHCGIGKQGRSSPQGDATTHVSPVHAHPQQAPPKNYDYSPPQHNANSDPNVMAHQANPLPGGDVFSAAGQNRGAQAGNVAVHEAGHHQKITSVTKGKKLSPEELARIIAEEKENRNKFPKYAGLERWRLLEKMGDGAFSNVYRAVDMEGMLGEVAIKVVRKFEMSSNQVSMGGEQRLFS